MRNILISILPISLSIFLLAFLPKTTAASLSSLDKTNPSSIKPLQVFIDDSQELTINDIQKPSYLNDFEYYNHETFWIKNINTTYWLRFHIKIEEKEVFLLTLKRTHMDIANLFLPLKNGTYQKIELNQVDNIDKIYGPHLNARLSNTINQKKALFLQLKTKRSGPIPLELEELHNYSKRTFWTNALIFFCYAILATMTLYNGFLFFALKDKSYLFYTLYMACFLTYLFISDGNAYLLGWDSLNQIGLSVAFFFVSIGNACSNRFIQLFADLSYTPLLSKLLTVSAFIFLFFAFSSLLFTEQIDLMLKLGNLHYLIIAPIIIFVSYWAWIKGSSYAGYLLVAWTALLIATGYRSLASFNVVEVNFIVFYLLHIAAAIESVILSLGLAARIKKLREKQMLAHKEQVKISNKLENELQQKELMEISHQYTQDLTAIHTEAEVLLKLSNFFNSVYPYEELVIFDLYHDNSTQVLYSTELSKKIKQYLLVNKVEIRTRTKVAKLLLDEESSIYFFALERLPQRYRMIAIYNSEKSLGQEEISILRNLIDETHYALEKLRINNDNKQGEAPISA